MACAVQATTHYQTYPERPPGADLPPKKVCNLGPMAPRSRQKRQLPEGPQESYYRSLWTPYYPNDSQLRVYAIYITRRVLLAAHARDVNIFIWTSRKSVDHGTNDRVKVHGDGTRADGRRSGIAPHLDEILSLIHI